MPSGTRAKIRGVIDEAMLDPSMVAPSDRMRSRVPTTATSICAEPKASASTWQATRRA